MSIEPANDSASTIRVIDDDDGYRTSMMQMLAATGLHAVGYRCVGEFLMAPDRDRAGCVLLDIARPGLSGIAVMKTAVLRGSVRPIICVTGYDDVATSVEAMKQGAFDYIVKPAPAERVIPAVRRALDVDAAHRAAERELAELRSRFARLTQAERAVLLGIVSSKRNKQIAADLGLCERTIKARRARMMAKFGVATVPELI